MNHIQNSHGSEYMDWVIN